MISEWSEKINELVRSVIWILERNSLHLWKILTIYKIAILSWKFSWLRKKKHSNNKRNFLILHVENYKKDRNYMQLLYHPNTPGRLFFLLHHCILVCFFFLNRSLLEYNCFTILNTVFLLHNKENQPYAYTCPHIPSLLSLPPILPIPLL